MIIFMNPTSATAYVVTFTVCFGVFFDNQQHPRDDFFTDIRILVHALPHVGVLLS